MRDILSPVDPNGDIPVPAFPRTRLESFLAGTDGAPPRQQLVHALRLVDGGRGAERELTALDIGCGPGKEALELLRFGFRVTAIDPFRSMLDATTHLVARSAPALGDRLEPILDTIEGFAPRLRQRRYDLVHAGFVLPFVRASDFPGVFDAIRASLNPGSIFVGQLFGEHDEFVVQAEPGTMVHHSSADIDGLFEGFDILVREEVRRDGHIGRGRAKHWHVHHIISRRM
ncbi:MAG: hypothetical protein RLZZ238_1766 [Planctomycetota bacterium]